MDESDLRAVAATAPHGRTLLLVEQAGRIVGTHALTSDESQKTAQLQNSWASSVVLQGKPPPALNFSQGGRQYKVASHGQVMHQGVAYLLSLIHI